jgi:thioredoxin-related protein
MKQLFTLILITGIFLSACTVDNSGYEPTQPVILNDTSQLQITTKRLMMQK